MTSTVLLTQLIFSKKKRLPTSKLDLLNPKKIRGLKKWSFIQITRIIWYTYYQSSNTTSTYVTMSILGLWFLLLPIPTGVTWGRSLREELFGMMKIKTEKGKKNCGSAQYTINSLNKLDENLLTGKRTRQKGYDPSWTVFTEYVNESNNDSFV